MTAHVHVHFVGFKGDEYVRAQRVFGPPDFVHAWHDHRMYGEVGPDDVVVFANKENPYHIHKYTWQDHQNW